MLYAVEIWTLLQRAHRTWQSHVQCRCCMLEKCAQPALQALFLPRAVRALNSDIFTWQSLAQCQVRTLEKCAQRMLQLLNLPLAVRAGHYCRALRIWQPFFQFLRGSCCSHLEIWTSLLRVSLGRHLYSVWSCVLQGMQRGS